MVMFWLGISVAFNVAQFLVFLLVCAGYSRELKKKEKNSDGANT